MMPKMHKLGLAALLAATHCATASADDEPAPKALVPAPPIRPSTREESIISPQPGLPFRFASLINHLSNLSLPDNEQVWAGIQRRNVGWPRQSARAYLNRMGLF